MPDNEEIHAVGKGMGPVGKNQIQIKEYAGKENKKRKQIIILEIESSRQNRL